MESPHSPRPALANTNGGSVGWQFCQPGLASRAMPFAFAAVLATASVLFPPGGGDTFMDELRDQRSPPAGVRRGLRATVATTASMDTRPGAPALHPLRPGTDPRIRRDRPRGTGTSGPTALVSTLPPPMGVGVRGGRSRDRTDGILHRPGSRRCCGHPTRTALDCPQHPDPGSRSRPAGRNQGLDHGQRGPAGGGHADPADVHPRRGGAAGACASSASAAPSCEPRRRADGLCERSNRRSPSTSRSGLPRRHRPGRPRRSCPTCRPPTR